MKKYILALIFGLSVVLYIQSVCAQIDGKEAIKIEGKEQKTCGENCIYEFDNNGHLLIKPINTLRKAYLDKKTFIKRKDFTKVKIDEGIVSIGDYAFAFAGIVKIDLPNTLNSIGEGAFEYSKLTKINLPSNLTFIGEKAFYQTKLKKIKIPDSITTIERETFAGNTHLYEVSFPKNLKIIKKGAFSKDDYFGNNGKLKSIAIPDTVTSIEDRAFLGCGLESLKLSESLKTIGAYAFYNNQISKLNIPASVDYIDDAAFAFGDYLCYEEDDDGVCETKLSLIISDTTEVSSNAFEGTTIATVYCRGDLDECKENLEDVVSITAEFKPISELQNTPTSKEDVSNDIDELGE